VLENINFANFSKIVEPEELLFSTVRYLGLLLLGEADCFKH
jgi:hypothetical protein